jgi:probable HAF family extracellular repeat protein
MKTQLALKTLSGLCTWGNRRAGLFLICTLTAALVLPAAAQTASFQGLGQMPGAVFGTYASAISGDGSTILGYGWVSSSTVRAYRWRVADHYLLLDRPGSSDFFGSGAVSFVGSVIVGENPQPNQFAAFRWTPANGLMTLPMNIAAAVSADGSMVAGGDNWWKTPGQTGIFGPFPGQQDQTEAFGLSPDGQVAVGGAIKGSDAFGPTFHAFRWTPSSGLQDLGLTTGTQSSANAISANGLVIVGQATDSNGFWRAFRWTASTGMQDIGTLGGPMSNATAVNMDGTVIVGNSLATSSSGSSHAFRWTAKTGMQDLRTALQSAGVKTANKWIVLYTTDGISADGTVIVGFGQSPPTKAFPFGQWEPFRAVLPVP